MVIIVSKLTLLSFLPTFDCDSVLHVLLHKINCDVVIDRSKYYYRLGRFLHLQHQLSLYTLAIMKRENWLCWNCLMLL